MKTDQFRAVIAVLLTVVIAFGLYLGWHVTHPVHHCQAPGANGLCFDR